MSLCLDLVSFADGELDDERAAAFRDHLRTCGACRTGLVEAMQLSAQLSTLTPSYNDAKLIGAAVVRSTAPPVGAAVVGSTAAPVAVAVVRSAPPVAAAVVTSATPPVATELAVGSTAIPVRARIIEPVAVPAMQPVDVIPIESVRRLSPSRTRRSVLKVGAVLVPAAAAVMLLIPGLTVRGPSNGKPRDQVADTKWCGYGKARPLEVRFAYRDATCHRPPSEVQLGSSAATTSAAQIPYKVLGALEARDDKHGLVVARAWNGENPGKIHKQLSELQPTPSVRSDRAAIEMMTTSNDNVEKVLTELEALRSSDDVAAARAARWNYAILLSRLDLPLSAAQAFRAIAAEQEAGWADEARTRAETQAQLAQDFHDTWDRASRAGQALVSSGAPVPGELVQAHPGVLRTYFYNAVRTAPSRDRVLALAPLAAELDRIGDPQPHVLSEYVKRVAKLDFRRRAPLARAYADLLQNKPVTGPLGAALTAETASADIADIVMGAMVERDVVAAHRDWFGKMAAQTGDRWFALVLAREVADAEENAGNWLEVEALLRNAQALCSPALLYQCLTIDRRLGRFYGHLHRVHESLTVLQNALRSARGAGEWARYRTLLGDVADFQRLHSATATARAYANELLRMSEDCEYRGPAYLTLAGAAVIDVDGRAARGHLMAALACLKPDLFVANYLSDIARLEPQQDDLVQLQSILSKVRASGTLTAAQQVLTYQMEGRVLVALDPTAGIALLQKTIAEADKMPREVDADKARAAAYRLLVFEAADKPDYTRALTLVAEELGLSPPDACAVATTAEGERAVVVVRGSDGKDRGEYTRDRRPSTGAPMVSARALKSLADCPRVRVMAPAALQGRPRVLPPELAWSYVTSSRGRATPPADPPAASLTLIVTNVMPPAYLGLAPLAVQPPADIRATTLSGLNATPARVLAAMANAGEIQFHTHALMDVGVSDASHLVLSPDRGRYALTAEDIRRVQLQGHPIVVLAACHSAQGATYEHAPWSLPDAFLVAGARAVFAAATEIPDVESGRFFESVLARVRAGVDPAVALRDQRLAADPAASSWVGDVILFE